MSDDEHNQLLLLTAALFAVRLFRDGEAQQRQESAKRAALDAQAIIAAVAKVEE